MRSVRSYIAAIRDPYTDAQHHAMQQTLLNDRFGVVMHTESRELPVYSLMISEGGPKFHESDPATPHTIAAAKGRLIVQKVSMPNIARVLSLSLDRLVLDHTGLTGRYTFRLDWNPAEDSPVSAGAPLAAFEYIALSSAMHDQLGLRLERQERFGELTVTSRGGHGFDEQCDLRSLFGLSQRASFEHNRQCSSISCR